jgi:hypothetical protein
MNTNTEDPLLLFILEKKLDRKANKNYEQSVEKPQELQSIEKSIDFLELQFNALKVVVPPTKTISQHVNSRNISKTGWSTLNINYKTVKIVLAESSIVLLQKVSGIDTSIQTK